MKTTTRKAVQFSALLTLINLAPQAIAQPFEHVAVGASHICALDAAGQVECTTPPTATRFLPPDDLPLMKQISAGQQHTCGITLDEDIECWGTDAFGVLQPPAFSAPVVALSAGLNHTCAIDINNQAQCWGLNTNRQLEVPTVDGGFVQVYAARTASCGIDTVGDIHCWSSDEFFNTTPPIAGPFIDLAIDSNQACGLTANGDITCWASRERNNLVPPENGPYIDLTVTNSAICGLRTDQIIDCSFPIPLPSFIEDASDQYPLDTPFSSIERSNLQFGSVPLCGIRASNGTISCFGGEGGRFEGGQLPPPPGSSAMAALLTASNVTLGLTAKVYGLEQVELFWNRVPYVFPTISVEVYRDDELLTTTPASFSFYDTSSSFGQEESRYRIRTVDEAGNVGEFSNDIVVNRITQEVTVLDNGGNATNPRPDSDFQIQGVTVTSYANFSINNNLFILSWQVNNPADVAIAGFEIRLGNELVDFVNGTTYIGEGVDRDTCLIHSVAAIAEDGSILDFASVASGRNTFNCQTTP